MGELVQSGSSGYIVVEASDRSGTVLSSTRNEVIKPLGPVRQHEQLLRAVMTEFPGARLLPATRGSIRFAYEGLIITPRYEDGLDRSAAPAETV